MDQKIEAPNDEDIERIARMILYAQQLSDEIVGQKLDGTLNSLSTLQRIIDSGSIHPEATTQLQCLGLVFGKIVIENNQGYDWWMVEDDYGRDPCVRYRETSILAFPQTMLSKRIEDQEEFEVEELYGGLIEKLEDIISENLEDQ